MIELEIAVTGAAGARVAADGGADRVELCSALELGGVTPSQPLIEATVAVGLPVHVLVRCRPGDFCYDAEEIALMAAEVRAAVAAGAAGVVIGALTDAGELDRTAIRRLADATDGRVEITLHRAIDQAADPVAAAAQVPALGLTRILTSGGAAGAAAGADTIARMAAADIQVMAGGGVRPADIPALAATGIAAVHLSAKKPAPRRATRVPLGADTHFVTDPETVAAARRAVDDLPR